jgi:hypothetical protein
MIKDLIMREMGRKKEGRIHFICKVTRYCHADAARRLNLQTGATLKGSEEVDLLCPRQAIRH